MSSKILVYSDDNENRDVNKEQIKVTNQNISLTRSPPDV